MGLSAESHVISWHLQNMAQVLVDGRVVGRLERSNPRNLTLPAAPEGNADAVLDILVEALGRVNFGCEWDFKGLTSPDIRLNGALLIYHSAVLLIHIFYSAPCSRSKEIPCSFPTFTLKLQGSVALQH